jgi:hypothetical protein
VKEEPIDAIKSEYSLLQKDVKISLIDEYKRHLQGTSHLKSLKNIKLSWDHGFFRGYVSS